MSKQILISTEYKDNTPYDLDSLFRYAIGSPFGLPTKANIYACVMGENDDSHWYWIFEVDGTFYFATGWCDYTGWDCQSGGEISKHRTLNAALTKAPVKEDYYGRPIKKWLTKQINGDEMIGVVTP